MNRSVLPWHLLRSVLLLWWIHWLMPMWWQTTWLHHHHTVSIASALWLNWIAHRRWSTHVVLLRGTSIVAWLLLSMRVVMFLLNMDFLHDMLFTTIFGTVFFIFLFILSCFDAVDDRSNGANNAQDGNDQADKRVTLRWVLLINWVLVIAVATIVKVVSIAIVIDE